MSFKKFLFLVFLVFLIFLVFDLSYLVHGVRCTYFRGEASAQIDDFKFFYTRPVYSKNPVKIPNSKSCVSGVINDPLNRVLEGSKSTAFVVIQNDSVVLEKYWLDGGEQVLSNSFSMAKSILSLLVGAAIEEGFIKSVEQDVINFIPEIKNIDSKKPVKIKHLLGMSSGYDWFENYKRPISVTAKAYYGDNIKKLMFKRSFISGPGEFFKYQSGDTQLLGILLERAVGENVSSYAERVLWSKIGATKNALWTLDSEGGMEKTFCCFNSTARDFAKIGMVMLGRGGINDSVIVSRDYVDWLLNIPTLKMGDRGALGFGETINHYSNSWYLAEVLDRRVFYAKGFLGQYIVVVPDLNLVFVRLGRGEGPDDSYNNEYLLTNNLEFFIEQVIVGFSN